MDNQIRLLMGINKLTPILSKFIYINLKNTYGDEWWIKGVINKLESHHRRDLPQNCTDDEGMKKLDIDKITILIADIHWNSIFSHVTTSRFRTYIRELRDIRNIFIAHLGSEPIENREVSRAFDTFSRLMEIVGEKDNLKELKICFDKKLINEDITNIEELNIKVAVDNKSDLEGPKDSIENELIFDAYCRKVVIRLRNDGFTDIVTDKDILKWTKTFTGIAKTELKLAMEEAEVEWITNLNGFKEFLKPLKFEHTLNRDDVGKFFIEIDRGKYKEHIKIKDALEKKFKNNSQISSFLQSQIMRIWDISYNSYTGKKVEKGYILSNPTLLYHELKNFLQFR